MSDARTLRLTDEGIEVPEALRGFTGHLHVETPAIPTDHIRMAGELYEVVDDREKVRA